MITIMITAIIAATPVFPRPPELVALSRLFEESGGGRNAQIENVVLDGDADGGLAVELAEDAVGQVLDREIGHSQPRSLSSLIGSSKEQDPKLMANLRRAARSCADVSE